MPDHPIHDPRHWRKRAEEAQVHPLTKQTSGHGEPVACRRQ